MNSNDKMLPRHMTLLKSRTLNARRCQPLPSNLIASPSRTATKQEWHPRHALPITSPIHPIQPHVKLERGPIRPPRPLKQNIHEKKQNRRSLSNRSQKEAGEEN